MKRGQLRIYLGAAPGVGKTFDMLCEGRRAKERGRDVVIGFVEVHGRAHTAEQIGDLEILPRKQMTYRGSTFEEFDVDTALARRPARVLVDELAHTNVPGSRNPKRWQDIEELLDAGIDVISTLNIQHLESLNDAVESITGVKQRETVPDEVVRRADQIELVDLTPEALRRRMAHGNIYAPEKVDAALSRYFRVGNLSALRELALLWLADRVDEGLERYRNKEGIAASWPARERVVVALTGGLESEVLLRRAARIASRGAGGELHAVYVVRSDGLVAANPNRLARQRALTEELGGAHHTVVADDVAEAVLEFARGVNAAQIVVGVSRRRRWKAMLAVGVSERIVAGSGDIDVHLVSHAYARRGRLLPARGPALGRRRLMAGWLLAFGGSALMTAVLAATRDLHELSFESMLFLALTVICALVGGWWPAVTAAVLDALFLNFFFIEPLFTLSVADPVAVLALVLFLVVAIAVASVVELAERRRLFATRAQVEADTLTLLNHALLRTEHGVLAVLELLRETFGATSAALLRNERAGLWETIAAVGEDPAVDPDQADTETEVSDEVVLVLNGRLLSAQEHRVLSAFATHIAVVLEREELARKAASVQQLEEGNRIRTALLAAVSHDLRTPLAGIKAAISSLRSEDMDWTPEDESELLAAVEESADRLDSIVANLLDLSRLQTGVVAPTTRDVGLDDVVARCVQTVSEPSRVELSFAPELPDVRVDPGLLDRVVANLVDNALHHAPTGSPVLVNASSFGDRVQLRIVDRGPGVPDADKERIFEPFQRLGDAPAGDGVGLGLAVAKGLTEAMGGTLTAEDTPGGGLTMLVELRAAPIHRVEEVPA
ncbi:MAG TPA: sensor histidine kinase KdpD [Nocardioidaceae bacterium]|nr:sensor histidine kinase KdpD [Nocardioidaceae bacterium]